jgi:hypothetical protein
MTDQDVIDDSGPDELTRLKHAAFSRGATEGDLRRLALHLASQEAAAQPARLEPTATPTELESRRPPRRLVVVAAAIASLLTVTFVGWQLQERDRWADTAPSATSSPAAEPAISPGADPEPVDAASPLAVFERPAQASDEPAGDVAGLLGVAAPQTRRITEVEGIPVFAVIGIGTGVPDDVLIDLGVDQAIVVCLYSDAAPDPNFGYECALVRQLDHGYISLFLPDHVVRWGMSSPEPIVSVRG